MNGRKKTKLKNSYFYNEEWYLECGSKYIDHGDVPEDHEVSYKLMHEKL